MTRPRDALGRPLTAGDPHAVAGVDPNLQVDDVHAWQLAIQYLEQGMPFHAHEVCELRWRQCPADSRRAWQALAQWCAALTHEARGHPERAARVAAKSRATWDQATHIPACIEGERVQASLQALTP
jgi:hypothetical protein